MVNFAPLAAEIFSLVWGTPGNFNWFRVLAAVLHGTLVVGVSQTAALNRGRHLYSAGRPSRWALAHILVLVAFSAYAFDCCNAPMVDFCNGRSINSLMMIRCRRKPRRCAHPVPSSPSSVGLVPQTSFVPGPQWVTSTL